jgi:hypothetical protein
MDHFGGSGWNLQMFFTIIPIGTANDPAHAGNNVGNDGES